jgi:hypothetical protein
MPNKDDNLYVVEAATGIALLIAPSVPGLLLFAQELSGPVTLTARFAGIPLLALLIHDSGRAALARHGLSFHSCHRSRKAASAVPTD